MKNTLHLGSRSARVKHTFVQECKCKYYVTVKKVLKCSLCRRLDKENGGEEE